MTRRRNGAEGAEGADLAARVLAGEIRTIRGGLQRAGVFDELRSALLRGIERATDASVASRARGEGLDRIHRWVGAEAIPAITDAAYREVTPIASRLVARLVETLLPEAGTFYYEREPNVRFHIPYDIAAGHRREFDRFARKRGQGKISAHAPHRDHWLDCPDNVINLWIAIGPVIEGNGLTLFPEHYRDELPFGPRGEVMRGVHLGRAITTPLDPGDVLLFHSSHLHGSEVNRTDSTRVVVSFRVSLDKPHFPMGHHHDYRLSSWERGPLRLLASWPARFQWSYPRTLALRLRRRLLGNTPAPAAVVEPDPGRHPLPLDEIPVGELRPVSRRVCVARFEDGRVAAFGRFCPHAGADLVDGHLEREEVICPWHNLRFDAADGTSECEALPPLRRYPVELRAGVVHVELEEISTHVDQGVVEAGGSSR